MSIHSAMPGEWKIWGSAARFWEPRSRMNGLQFLHHTTRFQRRTVVKASHRQDDSEFRLPAHHASIAFSGFPERVCFDHGADTGHFRKAERVLGVGRNSRRPAVDPLPAEHQLRRQHFQRVGRDSDDRQCAVWPQAVDQRRHRFAAGSGSENRARAAKLPQFSRRIRRGAVDINISAQLFRKRGIRAAADGGDAIAGFLCELNSQVAEPAHSLDGNKVARQRAAVTQSVEGGKSRAHQRSGFSVAERFGHACQRFDRRHHEFLIASVVADSANLHVRAVREISPSACDTGSVLPAMPAYTDALPRLPFLHALPGLVDHAGNLMPRHARIRNAGKEAFLCNDITVTDAACFNANPYLARAALPDFSLDDFKIRSGFRYLYRFHL